MIIKKDEKKANAFSNYFGSAFSIHGDEPFEETVNCQHEETVMILRILFLCKIHENLCI